MLLLFLGHQHEPFRTARESLIVFNQHVGRWNRSRKTTCFANDLPNYTLNYSYPMSSPLFVRDFDGIAGRIARRFFVAHGQNREKVALANAQMNLSTTNRKRFANSRRP
jgi:hypothetical protein